MAPNAGSAHQVGVRPAVPPPPPPPPPFGSSDLAIWEERNDHINQHQYSDTASHLEMSSTPPPHPAAEVERELLHRMQREREILDRTIAGKVDGRRVEQNMMTKRIAELEGNMSDLISRAKEGGGYSIEPAGATMLPPRPHPYHQVGATSTTTTIEMPIPSSVRSEIIHQTIPVEIAQVAQSVIPSASTPAASLSALQKMQSHFSVTPGQQTPILQPDSPPLSVSSQITNPQSVRWKMLDMPAPTMGYGGVSSVQNILNNFMSKKGDNSYRGVPQDASRAVTPHSEVYQKAIVSTPRAANVHMTVAPPTSPLPELRAAVASLTAKSQTQSSLTSVTNAPVSSALSSVALLAANRLSAHSNVMDVRQPSSSWNNPNANNPDTVSRRTPSPPSSMSPPYPDPWPGANQYGGNQTMR